MGFERWVSGVGRAKLHNRSLGSRAQPAQLLFAGTGLSLKSTTFWWIFEKELGPSQEPEVETSIGMRA